MASDKSPPPRIYCLPAVHAPVIAVFRRGPSQWSHIGRWDLTQNRYEAGGWLRGRIFPRRSDISPDGRWLCYFAHDPKAAWEYGESYIAVSKLPWLTALHAFGTCGTWTRGYYFAPAGSCDGGRDDTLPIPYGLNPIPVVQFANERRRGWTESSDSPPRHTGGPWDERRNAHLEKPQPNGDRILRVESVGQAGGEFGVGQAIGGLRVLYTLEFGNQIEILDDVQWADWDTRGRLVVATRDGRLQVRELRRRSFKVAFEEDLSLLKPAPSRAPSWAQQW